MLFQSQHLRISTNDGIATFWLHFPDDAWNLNRVREFNSALDSVLDNPQIDVLVIRADAGRNFSNGYDPASIEWLHDDVEEFARQGQAMLRRLSQAEMVTLAYIEGACRGPGFELSLACDYRLAVAGPDSWVGFAQGLPPCWGSSADRRLRRIDWTETYTAREAVKLRLFDDAFSQRRGTIELRLFLDEQQLRPLKCPTRRCRIVEAVERMKLREAIEKGLPPERLPQTHPLVEAAMRGQTVVIEDTSDTALSLVEQAWAEALRRGRITPLEFQSSSSAHARPA